MRIVLNAFSLAFEHLEPKEGTRGLFRTGSPAIRTWRLALIIQSQQIKGCRRAS